MGENFLFPIEGNENITHTNTVVIKYAEIPLSAALFP
jgi:hypothetical protein